MPREKINFDKKKLFQLFDKSGTNFIEKGLLLDISRFLFTRDHYHLLFDADTNTIFTKDILIDYLIKKGMPVDKAEPLVDSLISKGVLDINNQDQVYVPLLFHQHIASKNKKRVWSPKIVIQPPVVEKSVSKPEAVQITMAIENPDQQDLRLHLKADQQQSKQIKESAKEILKHLNEKTKKPKGFGPTEGNLRPIINRLKESFTVEDCKRMIDFKCHQWKDTPKESYLKPDTLFRPSNFEGYLNDALSYYKAQDTDQKHKLNDYIKKWFTRVAKLPLQMSHDQCEKIMTQCPDLETVKKCLLGMENDPKLMDYNNSVFLTLKAKLDRIQLKHGKTNSPNKSPAK